MPVAEMAALPQSPSEAYQTALAPLATSPSPGIIPTRSSAVCPRSSQTDGAAPPLRRVAAPLDWVGAWWGQVAVTAHCAASAAV